MPALRPLLKGALIAVAIAAAFAPTMAPAQPAEAARRSFNVPGGALEDSLNSFARQAGVTLSFDPALVRGKTAAPLQGVHSVQEGLNALLKGSGLESVRGASGITLRRALAQGEQQLPEVKVRARGENAWDPGVGYTAARSAIGTKTDTSLLETPRSISVVTAERIADQRAEDIGAALRYTPGVYAEHRGVDTTRPQLVVRGFRDTSPLFVDGMRGFTTNFNSAAPEIYGLERVEVLRGPSGTMYGAGSPGGMANGVTKRPTEEFFAEVEGGVGSYSQFDGRFDLGGPMDADRRVLFRFTGLARSGDAQIDFVKDKRVYLAPALTLRFSPATSLTLLAQYQKDDTFEAQFVPAQGTGVLPNPNGRIPTNRFIGEPGYGGYDKESTAAGWLFEHRWSDAAILRHNARYEHRNLDFRTIGGLGLQPDLRTLSRSVFSARDKVDSLTTDTNLQLKLGSGAVTHTVLAGVDYKRASNSEVMAFTPGTDLDIFDPVYGQPVPVPADFLDQRQKARQTGIYLQDQVRFFDRTTLTLGARRDKARLQSDDSIAPSSSTQQDSATTWQGGLSHVFASGIAPFANFAESFEPQGGTDAAGALFKPTTGTQYEAGVKYQPPGTRSLVTLSLFELTQQNVVTTDPANPFFGIQTGEMRSRGFEAEAQLEVSRALSLVASYSSTDIRVTKSNDGNEGLRPTRVPKELVSLWANYTLQGGALPGLSWGVGVRHVGRSWGDFLNTFEVPAFTLVDAALRYDVKDGPLKGTRFAVNASNLFDKTYVASCEAEGFCLFGQRRVVTASARFRF